MKDIWTSAKAAFRETVSAFAHLFRLLLFAIILIAVSAALVVAAYFTLRTLAPALPVKRAQTIAVLIMILPAAAFGWFAIVFTAVLEEKREKR